MQTIITITIPAAWRNCAENNSRYAAETEDRKADLKAATADGYKLFSTNSMIVNDVGCMLYTLIKE